MQRKNISFLLLLLSASAFSQSNPCAYWPAPCPHSTEISNARDWAVAKRNGRLPQEMVFEEMLKSKTEKIVNDLAEKNHWQVYEFNESSNNTPLANNEKGIVDTVPFEKRPPHLYTISYIFIIDPSVMKQWANWIDDFRDRLSKSFTDTRPAEPDERQKMYFDSAMYYTNLHKKYAQEHQEEYVKAVKANDEKYLKHYNDQSEAYSKKSDAFIEKYNKLQNEANAGPEEKIKEIQNEETSKTIFYRDASTILVKFSFNDYQTGSGIIDPTNYKNIQPQHKVNISSVQLSAITHDPLPAEHITTEESKGIADFDFEHPTDIGLLLVDGWNLQPDNSFGFYHAQYEKNPVNTGYKIKKPIATDHLRTLAVHIEGKNDTVQKLMQQLNLQELKDLIVH